MNNDWPAIIRRWFGRFSFSFLVVAFFLGWEGYKRYTAAEGPDARTVFYFIGAAVCLVLGFAALRVRHRG